MAAPVAAAIAVKIAKTTTITHHLQLSCLYESTNIYSGIKNYHQKFRIRKFRKSMNITYKIGKWSFIFILFLPFFSYLFVFVLCICVCVHVRSFSTCAIVQCWDSWTTTDSIEINLTNKRTRRCCKKKWAASKKMFG